MNHRAELVIALAALAHVAGIDAQFRERFGAVRHFGQQLVAIEMKVADQRYIHIHRVEFSANFRYRARGFERIDGDAHHLGAGARECGDLRDGGGDILGIGVGHRLDHDRCVATDQHIADLYLPRLATFNS